MVNGKVHVPPPSGIGAVDALKVAVTPCPGGGTETPLANTALLMVPLALLYVSVTVTLVAILPGTASARGD